MEKIQDLTALLKHEVEDLVSAEDQIIEAMPLMIERATNKDLQKALRDHLKVTRSQRKRLDQVQKILNKGNKNQPEVRTGFLSSLFGGLSKHECKGMKGLIDEGNHVMAEDMTESVMDAAIIAIAQKIEHYEICGYGTAKAYATELQLEKVAELLDKTLAEEYLADTGLTKLAVSSINEKAEGTNNLAKRAVQPAKATTKSSNGKTNTARLSNGQKTSSAKAKSITTKKVAASNVSSSKKSKN